MHWGEKNIRPSAHFTLAQDFLVLFSCIILSYFWFHILPWLSFICCRAIVDFPLKWIFLGVDCRSTGVQSIMVSSHHSSNADTMSLQIVHNVQCTCKPAQIANNLQYWSITYDCKSSKYAHLILKLLCHHIGINWQYLYISRQNLRQIFATIVVSWMKCSFGCLLLNMCPNIQISVVRRHFF